MSEITISQHTIPPLPPKIGDFLRHFYNVSDTPTAHEEYLTFFTNDADFVMASKRARGHQEILPIRQGMWTAVASRHHEVHLVFPSQRNVSNSSETELMLKGSVSYGFKDGGDGKKDWGAYARLIQGSDGEWKFCEYQVYLDTGS